MDLTNILTSDMMLQNILQKEAGMKNNLLSALMAILSGLSVAQAANQFNVDQQTILNAINDKELKSLMEQNLYQPGFSQDIEGKNISEKINEEIAEDSNSSKYPSSMNRVIERLGSMGEGDDYGILKKVAEEYGLSNEQTKLLFVIRIIENGRPGLEMGQGDWDLDPSTSERLWRNVKDFKGDPAMRKLHPARRYQGNHAKSLELQGKWAAGTVKNRYDGDLKAFAQRYCPANHEVWYRNALSLMDSN